MWTQEIISPHPPSHCSLVPHPSSSLSRFSRRHRTRGLWTGGALVCSYLRCWLERYAIYIDVKRNSQSKSPRGNFLSTQLWLQKHRKEIVSHPALQPRATTEYWVIEEQTKLLSLEFLLLRGALCPGALCPPGGTMPGGALCTGGTMPGWHYVQEGLCMGVCGMLIISSFILSPLFLVTMRRKCSIRLLMMKFATPDSCQRRPLPSWDGWVYDQHCAWQCGVLEP